MDFEISIEDLKSLYTFFTGVLGETTAYDILTQNETATISPDDMGRNYLHVFMEPNPDLRRIGVNHDIVFTKKNLTKRVLEDYAELKYNTLVYKNVVQVERLERWKPYLDSQGVSDATIADEITKVAQSELHTTKLKVQYIEKQMEQLAYLKAKTKRINAIVEVKSELPT